MAKLESKIVKIIQNILGSNAYSNKSLGLNTKFKDLGMDDIDCLDIVDAIKKEFSIKLSDDSVEKWKKISDVVKTVREYVKDEEDDDNNLEELAQFEI